ncbi:DUF1330 domain-containing protein [Cytobacillus sp. S13-E01]|uniref:DUF1330 domain-containing protein n=1 Tax=Cytobacillus sp. S13-E01 TaxID=3031326 RepID=UPI0023D83AC4|nr:DUF1330 domain-containing protein [Cytobacillus sp. S13-E01]MDF0725805.1 DUF1330 domain-containing protein [Cytobacillus sp. S13-E01]
MAVYALNLFNLKDKHSYATYSKEADKALSRHGGKVVAVGNLESSPVGDIEPRQILLLVEWLSKKSISAFLNDPEMEEFHPYRDKGLDNFVWHLFDKLEDMRPVLK